MNELNRMLDKIESQLGARSKSEIFELDNDIYMGLKNTSFLYKPNLNYSRIDKPTLTGRLVKPVTDKFIVQWDEMKDVYKGSINLGCIF